MSDEKTQVLAEDDEISICELLKAIALGVEARQDMLDMHSEKVTSQTVYIAQKMGFPEEKIQKWVAARYKEQSQKVKLVINSIIIPVRIPTS